MSQRKLKREPLKTPESDKMMASEVEPGDRRGWLSHGLAALAISALGLAVAGSVALTTSAETADVATVTDRNAAAQSDSSIAVPARNQAPGNQADGRVNPKTEQAEKPEGTLAFSRRDNANDTSRTRVRTARVAEKAAQREVTLHKTQQQVNKSATNAGSQERSSELSDTSKQVQANELLLIAEKKRKAEEARKAAEAAKNKRNNQSTSTNETPETDSAPAEPAEPETETKTESKPSAPKVDKEALKTNSGGGASPVAGAVVGSRFGEYGSWSRWHTGLDFRAAMGAPIRAVQDGEVLFAGNSGDWSGNHVAVKHAGGYTTQSSHMSHMSVSSGEHVKAGQVIGYVGQTGRAFGAHLHFELYPSGVKYGDVYKAIDPSPWLSNAGVHLN